MNNQNALSWEVFKAGLLAHPELKLQFQYAEDEWVKPSYHITEIKQAPITSVDCGGTMNKWTEIILQLWEPETQDHGEAMKASKALSIIKLVEKSIQLDPDAEVKIEFGNSKFDTRQLYPAEIISVGENLIVDLKPDTVKCKAIGREQGCGSVPSYSACCDPISDSQAKVKKNTVESAACCSPASSCC